MGIALVVSSNSLLMDLLGTKMIGDISIFEYFFEKIKMIYVNCNYLKK